MNATENLRKARRLIERGWARGTYESYGCYCAIGALVKAIKPDFDFYPSLQTLFKVGEVEASEEFNASRRFLEKAYLQDDFPGERTDGLEDLHLDAVNDANTKDSVLAWFDSAIRLSEEENNRITKEQNRV